MSTKNNPHYQFGYQINRSPGQDSQAMMRTSYDPEANAMSAWFGPEGTKSASTTEVTPDIMPDHDTAGNVIGIEALDVHDHVAKQFGQLA